MRHLSRGVLFFLLAATFTPALVSFTWQQSGWIGTCAGMGCTGRQALCATYSYTTSAGEQVKNYCYLDP